MKKHTLAQTIVDDMLKKGVKVTLDVWNELLTCCLGSEDLDGSSKVLKDMDYVNMYPDRELLEK